MSLTKEEKQTMINILKSKQFEKAYDELTDKGWWSDSSVCNDAERKIFLYESFMEYYYLLFTEGVKNIGKEESQELIHRLKIQLDLELSLVKKGVYTKVEA